ncbi:Protein CBG25008, partial [Caenorhabditis briggsae]
MDSNRNSLKNMPELVMEKILSDLDFFDLISLRKVCQSIRFFIDNFRKMNPKLQSIRITVEPKSIKSTYRFLDNSERLIIYQTLPNRSSLLKWDQKKRILANSNYMDIFLKDFEIFWKNQKLKMEKFQLDLAGNPLKIIYGIRKILAANYENNSNFELGKFEIETSNPCQIPKILSKINPKTLEIWNKNDEKEYWDLEEISKLNQWKNAKKLTINGFYVDPEIRISENFEKIDLIFEAISWEQVLEFKK